jgi:methyltransferase (TIGR00027 family)
MAGASRTAEFMALFRALESARPPGERLFHDPLAREFLSPALRPLPALARLRPAAAAIAAVIDSRWPGARASGIARTRVIDDHLRRALADGIGQAVLIGAGFDARALRVDGIESADVFEVDLPATQARKRAALVARLGAVPGNVSFVELDLDRASLDESLRAAGLRPTEPAFFIWEGVTNYLTGDGVDATLRSIAVAGGPGSRLAFTYVDRRVLDDPAGFPGGAATMATVRAGGEPWTFGLDPAETGAYLAARGLRLVEDLGSVEYRALFMPPRGRHMRGYEFYRVALAELT